MNIYNVAFAEDMAPKVKETAAQTSQGVSNPSKPSPASNLKRTAGPGRPKGSQNKSTKIIKDAVLDSFDRLGRCEYLVKLANGTASDRAAYMTLLGRVLPSVIEGDVDHKVRVELGWLQGRAIAQSAPSDLQSVGHDTDNRATIDAEDITPKGEAKDSQDARGSELDDGQA